MVSSAAPTSTTNMTGFFISVRGLSFTTQSHSARLMIFLSQSDFDFLTKCSIGSSEGLTCVHQQVLQYRPQTEGREKRKSAYDQNHGNQQACEKWRGHRKSSGGLRHVFLARQASRYG